MLRFAAFGYPLRALRLGGEHESLAVRSNSSGLLTSSTWHQHPSFEIIDQLAERLQCWCKALFDFSGLTDPNGSSLKSAGEVWFLKTRNNVGMRSTKGPAPVYELKITLVGLTPLIWRRVQVPSSIKLCCLHSAIQVVMGWTDSHLHQFEKDGKNWGVPEWDEFGDLDLIDESKTTLADVLRAEGDSMIYLYDFGDNWQHEVVLEKIALADAALPTHPICLGGERRCPLEDVGGVSGYEEFLEIIFDPTHKKYEHYVAWAGGHFEDGFDASQQEIVTNALARTT